MTPEHRIPGTRVKENDSVALIFVIRALDHVLVDGTADAVPVRETLQTTERFPPLTCDPEELYSQKKIEIE